MTIKPLFTAHAVSTGGRNGHTQADDGLISVDLSIPKSMGGPGRPNTSTPEHLFAAGYAACFGGALDFVGKQHKKDASKAKVTCAVSIGPREGGGFRLILVEVETGDGGARLAETLDDGAADAVAGAGHHRHLAG